MGVRRTCRGAHHAWPFVAPMLVFIMTSAVFVAHAATNPFADVPQGHWSYEALAQFARLGLVEGYSADAFGGGRVVTRYEMAWAVARLADRVKAGAALTAQQRDTLARLQEEFASELALVAGTSGYAHSTTTDATHDKDGAGGVSTAGGGVALLSGAVSGVPAGVESSAAGNGNADAALMLGGASEMGSLSQALLGVIPGTPRQLETSQAWSSLRLRLDPGMTAALSAIPGAAGREAFAGGKRLSELLGGNEVGVSAVVEPVSPAARAEEGGSQKQAFSIPLDEGAEAELSLGGPPVPGGIAPDEGNDVVARLDLKYALSQLAIFRASYELVKGDEQAADDSESKARATTLLGIDYQFALSDSAFIKAGYTYSRITDLVPKGIEWGGSTSQDETRDSGSKAAGVFGDYTLPGLSLDARKTTTSFGVGYTFAGTTSIVLGYRLIDFQDIDPETMSPGSHRTNVATAELTIRF
ncbi:MAG: S-layer homology domain-containing protein [Clostridia bacterium]